MMFTCLLSLPSWGAVINSEFGEAGNGVGGPHALISQTKDGSTSVYTYDRNGDLNTISENDTATKHFSYDANRKLRTLEENGVTSHFFFTTQGQKIATYDTTGRTEIFLDDHLRVLNGTVRYQYGNEAETNSNGDGIFFFLKDHLGSVVATLDSGNGFEQRDTLPYGEDWFRHTEMPEQNRGFNGNLKEGSLLDYNARHYLPGHGFTQADPTTPPGGSLAYNRYSYTFNNPVNMTDPSGNTAVWVSMIDKYLTMPDRYIQKIPDWIEDPLRNNLPPGENNGVQFPHLGHSGVLLINDDTGRTDYFEFGTYDAEGIGMVRSLENDLPFLSRGDDGAWTQESLDLVFSSLAQQLYGRETAIGPGNGRLHGFWFEGGDYEAQMDFALNFSREGDPDRARYFVLGQNCSFFACSTIEAGSNQNLQPFEAPPLKIYWPIQMAKNPLNRFLFRDIHFDPSTGTRLEDWNPHSGKLADVERGSGIW